MERFISIYCIENKLNDKVYIGKTFDIKRRWWGHLRESKISEKPLYKSIRENGKENFNIIQVCKIYNEDEANLIERELIKFYKTKNLAYNLGKGGEGRCFASPYRKRNEIKEIIKKRKENNLENLKKEFKVLGISVLSNNFSFSNPLKFKCNCKHNKNIFKCSIDDVRKGRRCRFCNFKDLIIENQKKLDLFRKKHKITKSIKLTLDKGDYTLNEFYRTPNVIYLRILKKYKPNFYKELLVCRRIPMNVLDQIKHYHFNLKMHSTEIKKNIETYNLFRITEDKIKKIIQTLNKKNFTTIE